jgi:hypothetical protein
MRNNEAVHGRASHAIEARVDPEVNDGHSTYYR